MSSDGFIRFSSWSQLARTVSRYHSGVEGWVVLVVDPGGLDVRVEASPSTGESFPHLYGPLPVSAVTEVLTLELALARAATR